MRRLNVLTWHTHGSYLYYLSHAPHDFHVLHKPGRPPGYGGRCGPFPFGPNVHALPAEQARERRFDCILFQDDHQWEKDQYEFLTPAQRALPRIYLEHDPPRAQPAVEFEGGEGQGGEMRDQGGLVGGPDQVGNQAKAFRLGGRRAEEVGLEGHRRSSARAGGRASVMRTPHG